jgi:preprotein translocase subunit SecA
VSLATLLRRRFRGPQPEVPWTLEHPAVEEVPRAAAKLRPLTDAQLAKQSAELRGRLKKPENRDLDTQVEAAALAMEAVRRTTSKELFPTQRLAGLVLTQGMIAEMQTGEGKTLSGALPIHYGALLGGGVHVMTTNPYLAGRDAEILRPALTLLGVSVGLLRPEDDDRARQKAYACDVTYGAGYEFGFDYLRDQTAIREHSTLGLSAEFERLLAGRAPGPRLRQRGLAWAVIDEIDSILLDEGTVPLLLSGPGGTAIDDDRPYRLAHEVACSLNAAEFQASRARCRAQLTERGHETAAAARRRLTGVTLERPWHDYVEKALTALHCFDRDIQYAVIDKRVVIVDDFTGRLQADRSWKDGLHQAVETKEGLALSRKQRTMAQTSRQRLLRRYERVCGMTGTAGGSDEELLEAYKVRIVRIPTTRPVRRMSLPDRFFIDADCKRRAAVKEVAEFHRQGRPVLIGSRTIDASRAIAGLLAEAGVPCQVLNGMQTGDEAEVVATAGLQGVVTVATNMAGRGTDIQLGPGVAELGGLHMLGLERSTSPRIDAQLAGRVARQGDPGSFQFFVSAEDPLVQEYAPELAEDMAFHSDFNGEIDRDYSARVRRAQLAAEEVSRLRRRQLSEHDEWMNDTVKRLYGA